MCGVSMANAYIYLSDLLNPESPKEHESYVVRIDNGYGQQVAAEMRQAAYSLTK